MNDENKKIDIMITVGTKVSKQHYLGKQESGITKYKATTDIMVSYVGGGLESFPVFCFGATKTDALKSLTNSVMRRTVKIMKSNG